jgi:nicotinic acid mononucleotide adenylyltransferase
MFVKHTPLNGVFWGCFDPPTLAHKAIALKALKDIPLKRLIIVINNHGPKT